MASTNKTTNYELSQFVGTDKPAWLSDYNSDMSKIDARMKTNSDTATGADGKADANATNIGDLGYLSTSNKNNLVSAINEVDGNTTTAQNTANSANTTANGCRTDLNKFNLSNRSNLTSTTNLGSIDPLTNVQFAVDTTNSIFKVYGRIRIRNLENTTGDLTVKVGDTSLRPAEAYEINSGVIIAIKNTQNVYSGIGSRNLKVNTDGSIYAVIPNGSAVLTGLTGTTDSIELIISPCLYFNTNFGDA